MRRFALVLLLPAALALSACGTIKNPVGTQGLAATEAAYGSAEALAVVYKHTCEQRIIAPSCRSVVLEIQKADNYAYQQIVVARQFIKNNPTIDAGAVVQVAKDAVAAFQTAELNNGVN